MAAPSGMGTGGTVIEWPGSGYSQDRGSVPVIRGTQARAGRTGRLRQSGGWSLRARLIALIAVTAGLLAINALLGGMPADAANLQGASGEVVVIVQPGDTLWTLAQQAAPQLDPRAAILEIRQANGMSGSNLMAGQRLVIPSFGDLP